MSREPTTLLNTTTLEKDDLLMINGGFVGGRKLDFSASSANLGGSFSLLSKSCTPPPANLGFEYQLHYTIPPHPPARPRCSTTGDASKGAEASAARWSVPCSVLQALPFEPSKPLRLFLLPVRAADLEALPAFLAAVQRITLGAPLLVVPIGAAATAAVASSSLPAKTTVLLLKPHASKSGASSSGQAAADERGQVVESAARLGEGSAAIFEVASSLLEAGVGTMLLSTRVLLLRDGPLEYLHGDADVEVGSEGWDDTSAYGYNHVLDDPSMGHTRSCHGLRIASHDAWLTYAQPTHEAVALFRIVGARLRQREVAADQAAADQAAADGVAVAEGRAAPGGYYAEANAPHASLYFSEELFLPAHNAAHRSGARTRVSNILCFGSSKLFFSAHLHERFPSHVPIAIHVSHHQHPDAPMRALLARYGGRGKDASVLTPFLIERVSQQDKAWCAAQRTYRSSSADGSAKLVAYVTSHGPWAWSGMTPFRFQPAGELSTYACAHPRSNSGRLLGWPPISPCSPLSSSQRY